HRDPGEPHADAATPGVPEVVTSGPEWPSASDVQTGASLHASPNEAPPFSAATDADILRPAPAALRLAQLKEALDAWVKPLVSAAVYAILIVTFGIQVARVEGQSMAPTLEDQDRLIVTKLQYRRLGAE